jgi:HEPN domain-containing protein
LSPPDRTDVARRWLRWADEDLALAEHAAADHDVVARGACVWAHQAAEKALKALMILRDIDPPKLHDLDRLTQRLPQGEGAGFDAIALPELTRWSIEGRYPADLDEATHADAVKAIAVATQVLDVVRPYITADRQTGSG